MPEVKQASCACRGPFWPCLLHFSRRTPSERRLIQTVLGVRPVPVRVDRRRGR